MYLCRYPKKENKEDAVQLTQKDIQILSGYSWDMGEYTSRFGFLYLGSDKENVKGLTKWQAEHIYQLIPIPPGMEDSLQNIEKSKRIDKEKQKSIWQKPSASGPGRRMSSLTGTRMIPQL